MRRAQSVAETVANRVQQMTQLTHWPRLVPDNTEPTLGGLMKLVCSLLVAMLLMLMSVKPSRAVCDPCAHEINVLTKAGLQSCNVSACAPSCGGTIIAGTGSCMASATKVCYYKYSFVRQAGAGCRPSPCWTSLGYKFTGGDCAARSWSWC